MNGQIPSSQLRPCDGTPGAMLLPTQAASWNYLRSEVRRRFGWSPTITSAGDAYRSLSRQIELFNRHYSTTNTGIDRRVWNGRTYWRRKGFPSAATPGTSNHGLGVTVDVTGLGAFDSAKHRQFAEVARSLGWSESEGRRINEPWHWNGHGAIVPVNNTQPGQGTVPTVPDVSPVNPISPVVKDIDMILVHHVIGANQAYFTYTPLGGLQVVPPSPLHRDLEVFKAVLPTVRVDGDAGLHPFVRATEAHVAATKRTLGL